MNRDRRDKNIANESSNTSGTDDVPLLDNATHKNCLIAVINMGLVRNTGPAFCKIDNKRCKDKIFERNSCDLKIDQNKNFNKHQYDFHSTLTLGLVSPQVKVSLTAYIKIEKQEKHLFVIYD